MGKSKIVLSDGRVLMDLTSDTVTKDKLLVGATAHGADGELINGACTYDADTSGANATAAEILAGKTAFVRGVEIVGEMPNNPEMSLTISSKDGECIIKQGYHDGSRKVQIDATEKAKLIPANIREGVSILDVVGTMSGSENEKKQSKEVTPTFADQTVLPGEDYTCLAQVLVKAIPYAETPNSAGGITVTIG